MKQLQGTIRTPSRHGAIGGMGIQAKNVAAEAFFTVLGRSALTFGFASSIFRSLMFPLSDFNLALQAQRVPPAPNREADER